MGDSGEKVEVKRWRMGARDAGDRVKRKQISSQSQFVLCARPPTTPYSSSVGTPPKSF